MCGKLFSLVRQLPARKELKRSKLLAKMKKYVLV